MKVRQIRRRWQGPVVLDGIEALRAYKGGADTVTVRAILYRRDRRGLEADNGGTFIYPSARLSPPLPPSD